MKSVSTPAQAVVRISLTSTKQQTRLTQVSENALDTTAMAGAGTKCSYSAHRMLPLDAFDAFAARTGQIQSKHHPGLAFLSEHTVRPPSWDVAQVI